MILTRLCCCFPLTPEVALLYFNINLFNLFKKKLVLFASQNDPLLFVKPAACPSPSPLLVSRGSHISSYLQIKTPEMLLSLLVTQAPLHFEIVSLLYTPTRFLSPVFGMAVSESISLWFSDIYEFSEVLLCLDGIDELFLYFQVLVFSLLPFERTSFSVACEHASLPLCDLLDVVAKLCALFLPFLLFLPTRLLFYTLTPPNSSNCETSLNWPICSSLLINLRF